MKIENETTMLTAEEAVRYSKLEQENQQLKEKVERLEEKMPDDNFVVIFKNQYEALLQENQHLIESVETTENETDEIITDLLLQFAYRGRDKKGHYIHDGGISALKRAFDYLGYGERKYI